LFIQLFHRESNQKFSTRGTIFGRFGFIRDFEKRNTREETTYQHSLSMSGTL